MSDKVLINEFLTFVQNKIDVIDEMSIVQICVSNFTEKEIDEGKTLLFTSLPPDDVPRLIHRKGDDKNKKSTRDVIKAFKETDPKSHPTFVTKDRNRLPPVTFDHVDVTRLLKDLVILKTEISNLRNESVSKSELSNFEASMKGDLSSLHSCLNNTKSQRRRSKKQDNSFMSTPRSPAGDKREKQRVRSQSIDNNEGKFGPLVEVTHTGTLSPESVYTPTYRDMINKPSHRPAKATVTRSARRVRMAGRYQCHLRRLNNTHTTYTTIRSDLLSSVTTTLLP
ncbi:hypothetical protein O0L34_g16575 [Tuta absoluta]|nr:hypothetical protein O0L34_g16575 [Tuta absoluta]